MDEPWMNRLLQKSRTKNTVFSGQIFGVVLKKKNLQPLLGITDSDHHRSHNNAISIYRPAQYTIIIIPVSYYSYIHRSYILYFIIISINIDVLHHHPTIPSVLFQWYIIHKTHSNDKPLMHWTVWVAPATLEMLHVACSHVRYPAW